MGGRYDRASEEKIALGVLKIASSNIDGIATFDQLRRDMPSVVNLTGEDRATSITRPNEPLWHQILRNIKSHSKSPGNFIAEGYLEHVSKVGFRITEAGRLYLQRKGY